MSRTLNLELSDEAFATLGRLAESVGVTPAQWAALTLERQIGAGRLMRTDAEDQAARGRFEQHFGEVDLGRATGADNESIDADLAREYAGPPRP